MTTHDVGVFPRVTSKQVDDVLQEAFLNNDGGFMEFICRDWLDMADRLSAAERVVAAAKEAGPFPIIANVPWHDGSVQECQHCMWGAGKHAPDCPGMELAEALTVLIEQEAT